MLRNYLNVAIRNILKHKFFSFINIIGMTIGIAACLLIVIYIHDELSFDRFHANADRIYQVNLHGRTVNNNIVQIFGFLGVVALLLSATGLYTLVSLNIIKRMKEIGVRKVLGASITNITRIINTEFAVMLLISSAIGCGLSLVSVDALMDSIWDYYLPASGMTLAVSVIILFTVSAVVVGYKIFSAASMNPVNTLRVE